MTRLVVVDATPYEPGPSGALRRTVELLRRVPALLPDDVFEVHWAHDGCGPPPDLQAPNLVHATVQVSCRGGALRWWCVRRHLRERHASAPFTHLLADYGPLVQPDRVTTLLTVHDLRFLHGYVGRLRRWYGRRRYGRVLAQAAGVIAVSEAVGAELQSAYGLPSAAVHVIANAAAASFRPPPRDAASRAGVLVVARDEPRKARGAAIAAARAAGLELRILDAVDDDADLRAAYRGAAWLLAPSVFEGFNLPIVEALACGTPVVASDIPVHRELVARGARGLRLVAPPTRQGADWRWPGAVAVLREAPPTVVAPPAWSWDDAARRLAQLLEASSGVGSALDELEDQEEQPDADPDGA